jgi:hypothetical protein
MCPCGERCPFPEGYCGIIIIKENIATISVKSSSVSPFASTVTARKVKLSYQVSEV